MTAGNLRILLSFSLIAAAAETAAMVYLNDLIPFAADWLILLFYLLFPYLAISCAALSAVWILQRFHSMPAPSMVERVLICGTIYLFFLNISSGLMLLLWGETPPSGRGTSLLAFAVILIGSIFLLTLAVRYYDHLNIAMNRRRLGILHLSLLITSLMFVLSYGIAEVRNPNPPVGASSGEPSLTRQNDSPKPRIVLLGLDCLDLDTIERLKSEGRIPNLASLLDQGSYGYLETLMPTLSPALWTSISTGKLPQKHNIRDFRTVEFPGIRRFPTSLERVRFTSMTTRLILGNPLITNKISSNHHYTSGMRTAKSIWNILSERGFRVGVVGWYVTWPAEAVNGFMVTERALLYPDDGRKTDPGLTYPEDLFESIRGFNIDPKNLTEESLDWLSQPRLSGGASHTDLTRVVRQNLGAARKTYARDLSSLAISLHLIETYDALDVLLIYFRAVDSLNHLVYKQITLEKDPVGESLYAITDNYYVFIDEVVGKISESLADNTILMIASDHGWTNEEAHTYAPPGLILMKGKSVKRGCRIEGASILDITPTILYLKGLPVAQDMDGRPLISCVDGDFLEEQAVAYLPTYEDNAQTTRAGPVESLVDEEMDEQLRALGYIK